MNFFDTKLTCTHQREPGPAPNWIITINVSLMHEAGPPWIHSYPQSKAVIDDFGNLIIVRKWQ